MSNTLQILIVEDDLSFALELEMLVVEIGYQVVGRVDNSAAALEIIFAREPDLILMDIEIEGHLSGLQIGKKISYLDIPVLYITSFRDDEYYEEALESNLAGYLVKPISSIELRSAIHLAIKRQITASHQATNITSNGDFLLNDTFFFFKKDAFFKVQLENILLMESQDKYCVTYTKDGEEYLARIAMQKMEDLLPPNRFFRIHRGCIIALSEIESINFNERTLQLGGRTLPISKDKLRILKEQLKWFR